MNRFAVFYVKELPTGFKDLPSLLLDSQVRDRYVYMGSFDVEGGPDAIFDRLNTHNDYDLGHSIYNDSARVPSNVCTHQSEIMQRLVVKTAGHTSMSVGDMVVDLNTGDALICANDGWVSVKPVRDIPTRQRTA